MTVKGFGSFWVELQLQSRTPAWALYLKIICRSQKKSTPIAEPPNPSSLSRSTSVSAARVSRLYPWMVPSGIATAVDSYSTDRREDVH